MGFTRKGILKERKEPIRQKVQFAQATEIEMWEDAKGIRVFRSKTRKKNQLVSKEWLRDGSGGAR